MKKPNQLFATKSMHALIADMHRDNRLRRILGPVTLTSLGIGAVIGAGIFVATAKAARDTAGPALMVSYMIAGVTCIFAALCYAEFASMVPVAGSAYTYAYCTMGELFAWIIGWDLVLEYAVGAATVANGWSGYFQEVIGSFGYEFLPMFQKPPIIFNEKLGQFVATGSLINLPAVLVVLVVTAVLIKGIQESAGFNALMVFIKVATVLFVIFVGMSFIDARNYEEFAPYGWGGLQIFGYSVGGQQTPDGRPLGVLAGAAIIFFAYIGFDSVSTHAEEAKNPQRDVPIGIIASLLICTVLYIAVVAVITGMVPYTELQEEAGVAAVFQSEHVKMPWAKNIISAAGVAGITSVLLVLMLSAPRVFLAMARDGLVPRGVFASVHPRFRTPWISTIMVGLFVAVMAGLLPLGALLEMTNIGTLFAFVIVCAAVLIMRRTNPDAPRPFRCPLVPLIPILGIVTCLVLMLSLPPANWWRLIGWLAIGLVIYFLYGKRHSLLGMELRGEIPSGTSAVAGGTPDHPFRPEEPLDSREPPNPP